MRKDNFLEVISILASELNLETIAVKRILDCYLNVCREDLLNGSIVRFGKLVTLVPDPILSEYVKTKAWYCKMISVQTCYSYYTVLGVVTAFLDKIESDLQQGVAVDLRTLCTFHPLLTESDEVRIRTSISGTIREELQRRVSGVISVRVHTSKLIKHSVKTCGLMPSEEGGVLV